MTNNQQSAPASQAAARPGKHRRALLVFLLACLVISFVGSYLVFKFIVSNIPSELVGIWEVTEGPLRGGTLEFRRDGTAVATLERAGKKEIDSFHVKVEEKKIFMTTTDDKTGKQETDVQTIVKLTEKELVIQDADRKLYRMVRVR